MGIQRKETLIGDVDKTNNKKIRVRSMEAVDDKGTVVRYADVRIFEQGRKYPFATRAGITVAPKDIDALIDFLGKAKADLDGKINQVQAQQPAEPIETIEEAEDDQL